MNGCEVVNSKRDMELCCGSWRWLDSRHADDRARHPPGGVLFELATDGPGFDWDEEPGRLGERLILPPWLEGQRESIQRALPALVLPDT
jgi:hypothetical protein